MSFQFRLLYVKDKEMEFHMDVVLLLLQFWSLPFVIALTEGFIRVFWYNNIAITSTNHGSLRTDIFLYLELPPKTYVCLKFL